MIALGPFALAVAAAAAAPAVLVPMAITTTLGPTRFDPVRQAVVLAYRGQRPAYQASPTPTGITVRLAACRLEEGTPVAAPLPPWLAGWKAAADLPAGAVRIDMDLGRPGEVVVVDDVERHELLLFPQPPGQPRAGDAGGSIATLVGRPHFDAATGAVVLPYMGDTPRYSLAWVGPTNVYLDLWHTAVQAGGPVFAEVEHDPLLTFWMVAPNPRLDTARVGLTMPYGGHVRVLDDGPHRRLMLVPQLGPAPPPAEPSGPQGPPVASGLFSFGGGVLGYRETFPAGDASTTLEGIPAFTMELAPHGHPGWLPALGDANSDWDMASRLRLANLTFQDSNLPLSLHTRQQWHAELVGGRRLETNDLVARVGAGYLAQVTEGYHSGAPPQPSYNFFGNRIVHGPLLDGGAQWKGGGWLAGWRLLAAASYAPVLWGTIDPGLPTLPGLSYVGLEIGVERSLGPVRLRATYRHSGLFGAGYDESFQGPMLGVTGP